MTFKTFFDDLSKRNGPAYGAGPAGLRRLMNRLGNPQNSYRIIHVAGTNGKGSVCHLCAEILQAAGYRTGLFVSPHLQTPTERIQINGQKISQAAFVRVCRQVLSAEEEKLNFFEILTACAFLYFAQKKAQYVVLETGLGGRKDPTNICRPAACVITSVGLDHCHILGSTLEQIAREKAGIIKKEVPVFCPLLPLVALAEIKRAAQSQKAPLLMVRKGIPFVLKKIDWKAKQTILQKDKTYWKLNLLGEKQIQNACLVYQLCRYLNVPESAIEKGFSRVQVPGRFEIISRDKKTIILDGAHNPQAMENLLEFMQKSPWKNQWTVVCGFMADKDYPKMLRLLCQKAAAVYMTAPDNPRAATLAQVKAALPRDTQAQYFSSPARALRAALKTHSAVLITGSFYLMGWMRKRRFVNSCPSARVRVQAYRRKR